MPFRLPPDQMRRLDRAAKHCRKTRQSFVQEIVLAHIVEIEQGQQLKKLPPLADGAQKQQERGAEQGGLGISAAIKTRQETTPVVEPLPPAHAPVVVQVGSAASAGKTEPLSDLERLALYVVKGDDFMRDARKRNMIEVLRASASTDEELNVLIAQLEQAISLKTKIVEENSPINKLGRLAFDKLTSLLKGD
jgi:predicted DNA-binding protein